MPIAAPRACRFCGAASFPGSNRCATHLAESLPSKWADRQRGTSTERGYGHAWRQTRKLVLARDGGLCRCAECRDLGRVLPAHEVDHIISKAEWLRRFGARPGVDDAANLQAINRDCHAAKTRREAQAAKLARAAGR